MPFRYRLQKVLKFRILKKEEQLIVVQKAQQAVLIAEENIRKNNEEIEATKMNMRKADPMMYETYDKYLIHLWEKAEQLELIRQEKQAILDAEKQKLVKLEQAVKILENHREKCREIYLEEILPRRDAVRYRQLVRRARTALFPAGCAGFHDECAPAGR